MKADMQESQRQESVLFRKRLDCVKKWPQLRGESKWAWLYLWELAGGQPKTIKIHPGSVGADQGANDSRTGANLLNRLAERGLIEIVESREELKRIAIWTIYINDPLEVQKQRFKKIAAGEQGELFEDDPPDGPPEEASTLSMAQHLAQDIARESPQTTESGAQYLAQDIARGHPKAPEQGPKPPQVPQTPSEGVGKAPTGAQCLAQDIASPILDVFDSSERRASISDLDLRLAKQCLAQDIARGQPKAPPPLPPPKTPGPRLTTPETPLGCEPLEKHLPTPEQLHVNVGLTQAVDRLAGSVLKSFEQKEIEVARQAERIFKAVGSPTLYVSVCEKIAWKIVGGSLPPYKLAEVLRSLAEFKAKGVNKDGSPQTPEDWRKYFVGAIKNKFEECDLDWFEGSKPAPPPAARDPPPKGASGDISI